MSKKDDTFKPPKRDNAKALRTPHMRALRKELLIARADVERMELQQATHDLRTSITHFSFLRFLMPGGGTRRTPKRGASGGGIGGILASVSSMLGGKGSNLGLLFKQYPIIGSVASLVLTKPVRTAVVRGAKPALKWGGLGLVAWEGWRIWQQMKAPHAEATTEAVDPTVF
ncbi:DUF3318 domain-containing protein [Caballeronia sp. LP006]|uniref:DUF3318 domain-containing protein n=1 Tax=unclassified Caballeronia TaxID=2646786 RepID=UPI00202857C7|nr:MULTISPECIES: DUF3318 domain-containing protein [unclassified Caballeronia]MDR5804108.1 DUF3318 domain-containing protein [Caballeronia sp. LZ001]MDR5832059.1 DUF3318 domain-containing protein [Caballeronia sp. LP006]